MEDVIPPAIKKRYSFKWIWISILQILVGSISLLPAVFIAFFLFFLMPLFGFLASFVSAIMVCEIGRFGKYQSNFGIVLLSGILPSIFAFGFFLLGFYTDFADQSKSDPHGKFQIMFLFLLIFTVVAQTLAFHLWRRYKKL